MTLCEFQQLVGKGFVYIVSGEKDVFQSEIDAPLFYELMLLRHYDVGRSSGGFVISFS